MARYPGAKFREIKRFRTPMPRPVRCNLHTAVTSAQSLYGSMSVYGTATSHFYIDQFGNVEQYIDTKYCGAADLDGNPDTISVETWDGYRRNPVTGQPIPGYGGWTNNGDVPAWNDAQMDALVKLVRWIFDTHPSIPRKLAIDSLRGPSSHGLSWHRLGVPYRVADKSKRIAAAYADGYAKKGALWYSTSAGKVCAGNRRISQIPTVLERAAGTVTADEESIIPDYEVQLWLSILGYYDVGDDGKYWDGVRGASQISATRRYQKDNGLLDDGWWHKATNDHFVRTHMPTALALIHDAVWHGADGAKMIYNYRLRRGEWAGTILGSDEQRTPHEVGPALTSPVITRLDAIAEKVGAPVEIDEGAIVAGVLAGLSPETIVAGITGLPREIALEVADVLGRRILNTEEVTPDAV